MRCPSCYRRLTTELVVHQIVDCPNPPDRPAKTVAPRRVRQQRNQAYPAARQIRGVVTCGTRSGYNAGCRCQPCRDAANEYIKARRATAQGKADYARYRANMKARVS